MVRTVRIPQNDAERARLLLRNLDALSYEYLPQRSGDVVYLPLKASARLTDDWIVCRL
jgi:hypothetical protein